MKNAFSNLNIYKYFFKDPKTASIEFVPQITNLDIDSEQFDKIIVKLCIMCNHQSIWS